MKGKIVFLLCYLNWSFKFLFRRWYWIGPIDIKQENGKSCVNRPFLTFFCLFITSQRRSESLAHAKAILKFLFFSFACPRDRNSCSKNYIKLERKLYIGSFVFLAYLLHSLLNSSFHPISSLCMGRKPCRAIINIYLT